MEFYRPLPINYRYYNYYSNPKTESGKSRYRLGKSVNKERKDRLSKKKLTKVIKTHSKENLDLGHQRYFNPYQTDYSSSGTDSSFTYVTQSKRLDDIEPLYGFNAVASYGPIHAALSMLCENPCPKFSNLKNPSSKKKPQKQVRFSDRLICRQFVRTEEEKELEKVSYKNGARILNKILKKSKKKSKYELRYPDLKVAWYLDSEYSLSNVSGLYPEEIAALKAYQTFSMPMREAIHRQRNLTNSPIPEEDEVVTESSISTKYTENYETCYQINEKSMSLESLPANSIDSGYDNSTEVSLENLKHSSERISLLDGLFMRAQTSAELRVAESLKKMNLPDWALNGLFMSDGGFEDKIPSIMTQSDNLDLLKSSTKGPEVKVKSCRSDENISILPRFMKQT